MAPSDPVRESAARPPVKQVIAHAIHAALCSDCDPSAGTGLTIRAADIDKAVPAVLDALTAAGIRLAMPGAIVIPAPPPLDDLPGYCDWSCASTWPVAWRWYDGMWLPVCREHITHDQLTTACRLRVVPCTGEAHPHPGVCAGNPPEVIP